MIDAYELRRNYFLNGPPVSRSVTCSGNNDGNLPSSGLELW